MYIIIYYANFSSLLFYTPSHPSLMSLLSRSGAGCCSVGIGRVHWQPFLQVVQGYKFNIFYPDLISRKEAPEYTIEKDPEADEFGSTCVLRFHAGPPYEARTQLFCPTLNPP
jgi:hypothetical protein